MEQKVTVIPSVFITHWDSFDLPLYGRIISAKLKDEHLGIKQKSTNINPLKN